MCEMVTSAAARRLGPSGDPNARALATPPGPLRIYETTTRGARRSSGQVLNDQHRSLVGVVIANADHLKRRLRV
jgi:hypothetical protein